jgi:hypothetical protein
MRSAPTHLRIENSIRSIVYHVVQITALGAKHTLVDGMILITFDLNFVLSIYLCNYSAANAAVRTSGFDFFIWDHYSIVTVGNRLRIK